MTEESMKTKEEILAKTKKYTRKNHGPNAHLKPQNYFFLEEDVSKAMQDYANQFLDKVIEHFSTHPNWKFTDKEVIEILESLR